MATPAPATKPQHVFEKACLELEGKGFIETALLITRDGLALSGRAPGSERVEAFAAMHAAALGAAELAFAGIGTARGVTLIAEQNGRQFVSRGLTPELFVVASVRADADCHALFAWMDELAARLAS